MKKSIDLRNVFVGIAAALILAAALLLGGSNTLVTYAESAAKVTATTANIRKEPNASSEIVGSCASGNKISITGQVTGSDGNVWYQVFVDANTLGYIRSDLVSITDGSKPTTIAAEGNVNTTSTGTSVSTEGVNSVNPVGGEVSGGQSVRVRSDASTSSSIVTTAENGLALTVTGTKQSSDDHTWYLVEFNNGGSSVSGYIRSDFVTLSGELVPAGSEVAETEQPVEEEVGPVVQETPVETKAYETVQEGDKWYLIDNNAGMRYNIADVFKDVETNYNLYEAQKKSNKTYRIFLIILLLIAVAAVSAAGFLFMKWRDSEDEKAMSAAEREKRARQGERKPLSGVVRKPGQSGERRPVQGERRPVQNGERRPVQNGERRPVQNGERRPVQNGERRPVQSGERRPVQSGERRPVQSGERRPVQSGERRPVSGQRPAGSERPSRPIQSAGEVRPERPVQTAETQAQAPRPTRDVNAVPTPERTARTRNVTPDDDDDFEFEFGNWDGNDE